MNIRLATPQDLNTVLENIKEAKKLMRNSGNTKQWGDNYPAVEKIINDIELGNCFICEVDESVVASFSFIKGIDSTYENIYHGQWINDAPYAVIHRIASNGKVKGVGEKIIRWALTQYPSIRIDTHEDNKVMQYLILKLGFKYCGIIITDDGTERLAYQNK